MDEVRAERDRLKEALRVVTEALEVAKADFDRIDTADWTVEMRQLCAETGVSRCRRALARAEALLPDLSRPIDEHGSPPTPGTPQS